jgi:hypothetical protein
LLAGASGAGKSTSARTLGRALSDELSVVHVREGRVAGTPYWNGSPAEAPLDRIVLLERGGAGTAEPLTGARAVAALLPHVIRYVADEALDRDVLARCAELCQRAQVVRVHCPEGDAFLPALRAILHV